MRVLQVLADATNVIAEGEVLQLMNCHNPDLDEEGYLEVIRYKTAKLFEAATRLGAILGGARRARSRTAMADYGMHLGTAFQLIDDVLDYSGDHARDRQERGRRSRRRQDDAAAHLRHEARHAPSRPRLVRSAISAGGLDELRGGARGDPRVAARSTMRARRPRARVAHRVRGARARCRVRSTGIICYNWPTSR